MADSDGARWDQIYSGPIKSLWGLEPVPGAHLLREAAAHLRSHSILDVGCGDGRNLRSFHDLAPIVVGADVSRAALGKARQNLPATAHSLLLVRDDISDSAFGDESFDAIACLEVLSHLSDAAAALRELHRIVRAGGIVVVDVFTENDCTAAAHEVHAGVSEAAQMHPHSYTGDEAMTLMARAGFEVGRPLLRSWMDQAHPGVREYPHRHEAWTFVLRKQPS